MVPVLVAVPDAVVRQGSHSRSVFRILKQLIIYPSYRRAETKKSPPAFFGAYGAINKLECGPLSSSSGREPFNNFAIKLKRVSGEEWFNGANLKRESVILACRNYHLQLSGL